MNENDNIWKFLGMPWVALPVLAINGLIAWDKMPERVPMKINANGMATSWSTRGHSIQIMFEVLLVVVVASSAMLGLVAFQVPWRLKPASIIVSLMTVSMAILLAWVIWTYQVGA